MNKSLNVSRAVVRSPVLWGGLAAAGFYGLVRAGVLRGKIIDEYFASHPVEYVATALFFVALASLLMKLADVVAQSSAVGQSVLGSFEPTGQIGRDCDLLLARLDALPAQRHEEYLIARLREAIESVRRRGSADQLDEQLKYLAELDQSRAAASYALVRLIVWAIPILGFLGTVIGITLAIAHLVQGTSLADGTIETAIPAVVGGLSVAFGTTAQALVLSIVLMFAQFYTDRKESALLAEVDRRAAAELEGRFLVLPKGPDASVAALDRACRVLADSNEGLVRRQAEIWRESIETAGARWTGMTDSAGKQLREMLSAALGDSLKQHARELAAAEQAAFAETRRHWDRVEQSVVQQTHSLASLQASVARQAEALNRAVEAVGQILPLEEALNRNLAALAGAKHFEQTVVSLAAAIQLLSARLADGPPGAIVRLEAQPRGQQAA